MVFDAEAEFPSLDPKTGKIRPKHTPIPFGAATKADINNTNAKFNLMDGIIWAKTGAPSPSWISAVKAQGKTPLSLDDLARITDPGLASILALAGSLSREQVVLIMKTALSGMPDVVDAAAIAAAIAANAAAEKALEDLELITAHNYIKTTELSWSTPTTDYFGDVFEDTFGRTSALSVPSEATIPRINSSGTIDESLIPSGVVRTGLPNFFYGRQTFDAEAGIVMGDVALRFLNAHGGNRFTLEPLTTAPNSMPYFDVYASTAYPNYSSGDDVGGATGGYQIHVEGRAGEINRAYWHTEAHADSYIINGDEATRGYVSMGMAKRGTGRIRSFVLLAGTQKALDLHPDGDVHLGNFSSFISETPDGYTDNRAAPIRLTRRGSVGVLAVTVASSESPDGMWGYPFHRLSRLNGDNYSSVSGGSGAPKNGDTLGAYQAGSGAHQRDSPRIGGDIRFKASENWSLETSRGTASEITYTPKGGVSRQTGVRVEEGSNNQSSMLIQINREGTRTLSRVEVGPPDSAGVGYRTLRVAN